MLMKITQTENENLKLFDQRFSAAMVSQLFADTFHEPKILSEK